MIAGGFVGFGSFGMGGARVLLPSFGNDTH